MLWLHSKYWVWGSGLEINWVQYSSENIWFLVVVVVVVAVVVLVVAASAVAVVVAAAAVVLDLDLEA